MYPDNMDKVSTRSSHEHKVIATMLTQLPDVQLERYFCLPSICSWMPWYNEGYRQTTWYTFEIDLRPGITTVQQHYRSSIRNHIKKASTTYTVTSGHDIDLLLPLVDSTLQRKGKSIAAYDTTLRALWPMLKAQKVADIYLASDGQGDLVAGSMIVRDQGRAYLLLLGLAKESHHRGAIQLLIDHSIQASTGIVDTFDMEGTMIPEVEPMFRAFGGDRVPYHVISKAPWWVDVSMRILRKKVW